MSESNPTFELESRIAEAVFSVLRGRRGFYAWWDDIDGDTQDEIRGEVARAALIEVGGS